MDWSQVGTWLVQNAGTGAALVGSLLTGNAPAAIGLGAKLVASATGHADPEQALKELQENPETLVKLKELALQEQAQINDHIEKMAAAQFADAQAEQHETQETIRNGDKQDDRVVRWTRPLQSWLSLCAAIYYGLHNLTPDITVLGALLTLPFTYAGLRTVQHWNEMKANVATALSKQ